MSTARPFVRLHRAVLLALLAAAATTAGMPLDVHAQPWQARHGLTAAQHQAAFDELTQQGYRLVQIDGYEVGNASRYASLWEKRSGPAWQARHGLTAARYQAVFEDLAQQGYRLVLVDGHTVGGTDRYAGIWEKAGGPAWVARHGLSGRQYQAAFDELGEQGYRLVHVSGYGDGSARYAALWEKRSAPAWVTHHGLSGSQYQQRFDQYLGQGYRLIHVDGYRAGGAERYAAIWEKSTGPAWSARHGMTAAAYQGEFDNHAFQGYRLRRVSGNSAGSAARYAAIWESQALSAADLEKIQSRVDEYMRDHGVPGLSVAITKDEKLVYARGFGLADQANAVAVSPRHRFRVASVSKPITSIAVMKMIDDGGTGLLDRTVFGRGGLLGTTYGTAPYEARETQITVRHLLEHTSGWDNDPNDVMFDTSGMTHAQLIAEVLDNRSPARDPGVDDAYLNFGYSVLGRIIEARTGQSYETWVRQNVLAPAGITRMEIAGDTLAARKADEVVYYGGSPYTMPVARMDAHGGWLASPIDLTRLLVRVDGRPGKPDLLSAASRTTMLTPSAANPGYAKGWIVDSTSQSHNGAFSGSIAFAWIRDDGYTAAVFANTRPADDGFAGTMRQVIDGLLDEVTTWPTWDMF